MTMVNVVVEVELEVVLVKLDNRGLDFMSLSQIAAINGPSRFLGGDVPPAYGEPVANRLPSP